MGLLGLAVSDQLITLARVPLAVVATVMLCTLFFLAEAIMVLLCLPVFLVSMSREELRVSWISRFPNSVRAVRKVWYWVRDDWPDEESH